MTTYRVTTTYLDEWDTDTTSEYEVDADNTMDALASMDANTRLLRGWAPIKKTVIEVVTKFPSTTISGD
jgi:hypothetical protein